MKYILLCVLVLWMTPAQPRDWDQQEIQLGVLATTAYVLDWRTTRDMTKRYNDGYAEGGPVVRTLFGSRPSTNQINMYFTVLIPTVLFTANSFPEHRKQILTTVIVAETLVALNNKRIGLSFNF